jgi:hypothetical protein
VGIEEGQYHWLPFKLRKAHLLAELIAQAKIRRDCLSQIAALQSRGVRGSACIYLLRYHCLIMLLNYRDQYHYQHSQRNN